MENNNPFDEINKAVKTAELVNRACDNQAAHMVMLIKGRLRHVGPWLLKDLKKELASFNAITGEWKD